MNLNWIFDILVSTAFEIPSWLSMLSLPLIGYFCWHNVYDYNDLCDCVDALGANDATIFIPNQQDVDEDCTIPANIALTIIKGGSINIGKFSIRNATYQWTVSPAQAGEYYLELAGGGDPGLTDPLKVYEDDVLMTLGTLGALAVGEWNYGNNDALGFDTIYVRVAGTVDPDTLAVDYVEAGYVVTILGWIDAGAYEIFEGYGSIVLGPLATEASYPEWWSAE